VISAHTEARDEGYFRREWKQAVDRTHDMAEDKPFVLPVAIDGTSERSARVPDSFKGVQWTRLPGGETPAAFVEQVRRLLSTEACSARAATPISPASTTVEPSGRSVASPWWSRPGLWVTGTVLAVALAYLAIDKLLASRHLPLPTPAAVAPTRTAAPAPVTAAAFNPPRHSIAVLPFVNMSGDKEQQYFSDGLTEELLNSLSRISQLQVAARTSSFSFTGEHPDIATVARKLNVAAVLEGSVRRSASTVRISMQLINGVTGFRLWSETYDRDLGDVLKLQTEIATAVASALQVNLLGDEAARIEVGGTHNPAAFDAYLRAMKLHFSADNVKDKEAAIAGYTEAIQLDRDYALAYAGRSMSFESLAEELETPKPAARVSLKKAEADARKALTLAPGLAEAHLALAWLYTGRLDFTRAMDEYQRALALGSGNAHVLRDYGLFAVAMGREDSGLTMLRRAVVLDPLSVNSHSNLGDALLVLRRYDEAIAAYTSARALDPEFRGFIGIAHYLLGDFKGALSYCEASRETDVYAQACLAATYDKLGRHSEAEAMLAKMRARVGDSGAMYYAQIYAQWGNKAKALQWLDTALRLRDTQLQWLKVEPFLDPLRNEPRFQAIERELRFPS